MDVHWLDPADLRERDLAGAVAVQEAARVADGRDVPGPLVRGLRADVQHGWDGDPGRYGVVRDGRDRVVAVLEVHLPLWDNTHLGFLHVVVDPPERRAGLGRRLFAEGLERVVDSGRRLVLSDALQGSAGEAFLAALGLRPALTEAMRRQRLPVADLDAIGRAHGEGRARAYDLVRLRDPVPAERMDDVLRVLHAINDAPLDDLDVEDEVFSAERQRAFERSQEAHGMRVYRLLALHRETGAPAGHTVVGVDAERPWWAWQYDTSVVRAHRGSRLGLALKLGMLRWLEEEEPQLRALETGNAASNAHMIAVNEALGYRLVAMVAEWQASVEELRAREWATTGRVVTPA